MLDWGDGEYELTAQALRGASDVVIELASVRMGESVLDLGCGTGNASLIAAARGAVVTGIDPASRLVTVAQHRAREAELNVQFAEGDAQALSLPDGSFDCVVAVFSVIFAPDPIRVAAEMRRVTRPGGRMLLASWVPAGAIYELVKLMLQFLPAPPATPPPWGERDYLRERFAVGDARVSITEHNIAFVGKTPEAWFSEQETAHPAWRTIKRSMQEIGDQWSKCRQACIELLMTRNEDPDAFRVTSRYLVTRTDLPG